MPSIDTAFPSKYVRASDLGSTKVKVTISHLKLEDVGGDGERKPVLYFNGKEKGFVLNRTNANKLSELAGTDDYSLWGGLEVKLYATTTEYKGKETPCIRIEGIPGAKPSGEPMPSADENEVPF